MCDSGCLWCDVSFRRLGSLVCMICVAYVTFVFLTRLASMASEREVRPRGWLFCMHGRRAQLSRSRRTLSISSPTSKAQQATALHIFAAARSSLPAKASSPAPSPQIRQPPSNGGPHVAGHPGHNSCQHATGTSRNRPPVRLLRLHNRHLVATRVPGTPAKLATSSPPPLTKGSTLPFRMAPRFEGGPVNKPSLCLG